MDFLDLIYNSSSTQNLIMKVVLQISGKQKNGLAWKWNKKTK